MAKRKNGSDSPAVQTPEPADEFTLDLAPDTLTGDVRDFLLDRLRYEQDKRPWTDRSEVEQRQTVADADTAARRLVREVVELIAAEGQRIIKATIESVTVKDRIKAVLTMSKFDGHRHYLIDATGSTVLIVVADSEQFVGERAPAEIKPDQPELPSSVVHSEPDGQHKSIAAAN